MNTTLLSAIDWPRIDKYFQHIMAHLKSFKVLSGEEEAHERLKLSWLTYGLISSPLLDQISHGHTVQTPDPTRLEALRALAFVLGADRDTSEPVPEHIKTNTKTLADHVNIVQSAIESQSATTEFVISWGVLNQLWAKYQWVRADFGDIEEQVLRGLTGARAESASIQKYWYAHWIHVNAPSLAPRDRADASMEFQLVCEDVVLGNLKPWGPYPKPWFYRPLIVEDESDTGPYMLRSSFPRISAKTMSEMIKHPLITRDILPPLGREEFEKID